MTIDKISGISNQNSRLEFTNFNKNGDDKIDAADFEVYFKYKNYSALYSALANFTTDKDSKSDYVLLIKETISAIQGITGGNLPNEFAEKFIAFVREQGETRVKDALLKAGWEIAFNPENNPSSPYSLSRPADPGYSRGLYNDDTSLIDINRHADGTSIEARIKYGQNKDSGLTIDAGVNGDVRDDKDLATPQFWGGAGYKVDEHYSFGAVIGATPGTREVIKVSPDLNDSIFNELELVEDKQVAAGVEINAVSKPDAGKEGYIYGATAFGGGLFLSEVLKENSDETSINNGIRYYFGGSLTWGIVKKDYNLRFDASVWGQMGENKAKDEAFDDKEYSGDTNMIGYTGKIAFNHKKIDLVATYAYMNQTDDVIEGSADPDTGEKAILREGTTRKGQEVSVMAKYRFYNEGDKDLSKWFKPAVDVLYSKGWGTTTNDETGDESKDSTWRLSGSFMLDNINWNNDGMSFTPYINAYTGSNESGAGIGVKVRF